MEGNSETAEIAAPTNFKGNTACQHSRRDSIRDQATAEQVRMGPMGSPWRRKTAPHTHPCLQGETGVRGPFPHTPGVYRHTHGGRMHMQRKWSVDR